MDLIKFGVGAALAVAIIGTVMTSTGASPTLEDVNVTSEWNDALDDTNSQNFTVNDALILDDADGLGTTNAVDVSDRSGVSGTVQTESDADVTFTVYDGNDTQLSQETITGQSETTFTVGDSVDSYYLEFSNNQASQSTIDAYTVESDETRFYTMLGVLVIGVIGAALIAMLG